MKPEEQRIAIAEVCGWTQKSRSEWVGPDGRRHSNWGGGLACPDYLNDLNAMHEASLGLDRAQKNRFVNILSDMTCTEEIDADPIEADFAWVNATAAQRAEAFLKTLNLWTE